MKTRLSPWTHSPFFGNIRCGGYKVLTLCHENPYNKMKIKKILATGGRRLSPGISVSSTNKTDHNDITEILLKVVFNTIALAPTVWYFLAHLFVFHLLSEKFQSPIEKS